MDINEVASLGSAQGFRRAGDVVVGVHRGYPFSLRVVNKNHDTVTVRFQLSKRIPSKVLRTLKRALPPNTSAVLGSVGDITITGNDKNDHGAYQLAMMMLNSAADVFENADKPITLPDKCPLCKKDMCDSAALVGGQFVPVHRQCVTESNQQAVIKAEENQNSGNYPLGFIGAFLGAIVGCIPSILTIFLLESEFGLLYMLIPIASYTGYKLFKGKLGGFARFSAILCSVLAFVVMQPAILYVYVLLEGHSGKIMPVLNFYISEYLPGVGIMGLVKDTWFGILFLVIGIFSAFKNIGSTNQDRIAEVSVTADSLIGIKTRSESASAYTDR